MDHLVELFVPIVAIITSFGATFGVFYIAITSRNKERMALIERGADPKMFQTEPKPYSVLKYGLFFVGTAIGVFLGNIFAEYTAIEEATAYISMILLFGGLGLIAYYMISRKLKSD